jgi:hypothetical protein
MSCMFRPQTAHMVYVWSIRGLKGTCASFAELWPSMVHIEPSARWLQADSSIVAVQSVLGHGVRP